MERRVPLLVLAAAIVVGLVFAAASDKGTPELEARIASLERQVATLEAQAATETTRAHSRRSTADASAVFQHERRDRRERTPDVAIDLAPGPGAPPRPDAAPEFAAVLREAGADPEVRQRLGRVIRDEMDSAQEERREERRDRRADRRERRLEQLSVDAGLSAEQTDFLSVLLSDESEAASALFRAAREEGSWGEAHDRMEDLRTETDEQAAEQLDGGQRDAYQAMREEEEARRFGRRH